VRIVQVILTAFWIELTGLEDLPPTFADEADLKDQHLAANCANLRESHVE
jgi:hypothetical protein